MEKKNNKRKVMLIAIFAVAVIALAGIGYAAVVGYKGTTVISNNTATGKSIVVTDAGGTYVGSFGTVTDQEVKINTYTDATYKGNTTLYTIDEANAQVDTGKLGKKIGQTLSLSITGDTATNYSVTVKLIGTINSSADWSYYIKIDNAYHAITSNTASFAITKEAAATQTVTAELYIASANVFESNTFSSKAIGNESLTGYTGYATAQSSPVNASGLFFQDLKVAFTFETAASS